MKKIKESNFLKTVIMTLSLALCVSLLLKYIPNTIVKIVVNVVVFGLLVAFLVFKKKDKLILIAVPAFVAFVLSYFISTSVIQMIIAILWIALLLIGLFVNKLSGPFKATMIFVTLTMLLTWVIPVTSYSYSLNSTGKLSEVGMFDFLSYGNVALSYFGNISFYIISIGVLYGVLYNIGAYRNLLNKIAEKSKNHKKLVLILIVVLLSIITAVCGTSMGFWFIIPFIVSLVLLMGYNKFTAALVGIGPMLVGLMGNLFSSTYISSDYSLEMQNGMGIVNSILNTSQNINTAFQPAQVKFFVIRLGVLLLGIAALIVNIVLASRKEEKKLSDEDKSLIPEVVENKSKVWPIIVVLDLLLIVCALSMTSWSSVFNVKVFEKLTTNMNENFGLVFSGVKAFERWTVNELSSVMILASAVLALIYKVNLSDWLTNALKGIKKALKPALIVVFIYIVLVIVSYNPIVLTIVKPLIGKHLNVFTMGLTAFVTSIFNIDMYYSASSVLPYVTSMINDVSSSVYPGIAVIWQVMFGLVAAVAPTSIVLVPVLSYMDISFKDWVKHNWLFLAGLVFISALTLIVLLLVI